MVLDREWLKLLVKSEGSYFFPFFHSSPSIPSRFFHRNLNCGRVLALSGCLPQPRSTMAMPSSKLSRVAGINVVFIKWLEGCFHSKLDR
jgi:hypothetical protein